MPVMGGGVQGHAPPDFLFNIKANIVHFLPKTQIVFLISAEFLILKVSNQPILLRSRVTLYLYVYHGDGIDIS